MKRFSMKRFKKHTNGSKYRKRNSKSKSSRRRRTKSAFKTKKRRGGTDEEMGPEVSDVLPYSVPPDPERFKHFEKTLRSLPVSPEEAAKIFAGPTPELKQIKEGHQMANEDPLNKDPFDREDLEIFSKKGGKKGKKFTFTL
jgi:hypothetical protein